MKSVSLASPRHLEVTAKPGLFDGLARRVLLNRLADLREGRLVLVEGGVETRFGESEETELSAKLEILDRRFYVEVTFGGSIGAGEAYMQGFWKCDDLVKLIRILVRNRSVLEAMESGMACMVTPALKLFHWMNRNTRKGARRNIAAHYDLGNEFFALWLDQSMMYSCALFTDPEMTLNQAQVARLESICAKLKLTANDHVLEIGTGWGGFALFAAKNYGCRVTTTTISRQQYEMSAKRIAAAGLQDRVTLLSDDFRDLHGKFDKLVSIEMIEAIGSSRYKAFFRKCSDLLKPDGLMLLQAITIADQNYAASQKSVDFIKRYIFPGGCLPSSTVLMQTAAENTDMRLLDLHDLGLHYATTLRYWRQRFFECIEAVRAMGYPEPFIRMWTFYLCYCEGAFLERAISDVQMLFCKPRFLAPSPRIAA